MRPSTSTRASGRYRSSTISSRPAWALLASGLAALPAVALLPGVSEGTWRLASIGQAKLAEVQPARRPPRSLPETAESFADTIGVVVHLVYADSSYASWPEVDRALRYLGVKRLREIAPLPTNARIEHVHAAADAGYRFTFLVLGQIPLADSIAALADFRQRHPSAIAAIEGPNEVNNFPFPYKGLDRDAAAQAFQADLYAAVRRHPALRDVPVYNLTSWPDLGGTADFANFHSYAHGGQQARATLLADMARQQAVMPAKPVVLTEAGYHNTIGAGLWEGVDEATAAPMILNLLFDAWAAGVSEIDLYQLLDGYPDPGGTDMERHFGLFDTAYRPKPAAVAVRNLLAAMRDRGPSGRQLPSAAVAETGDLGVVQLGRGDGARLVALYRRARLWDADADRAVAVAPSEVAVRAPVGATRVTMIDPVHGSRRTAPVAGDVTLALADVPLLLVFHSGEQQTRR